MRWLYLLFLVAFVAFIGVFVYQNQQPMTLDFGQWTFEANVALVTIVAYVLGMLSGWSLIGLVRRSLARIAAPTQYAGTQR
jgi:lipopolysaccharide assembly protein A